MICRWSRKAWLLLYANIRNCKRGRNSRRLRGRRRDRAETGRCLYVTRRKWVAIPLYTLVLYVNLNEPEFLPHRTPFWFLRIIFYNYRSMDKYDFFKIKNISRKRCFSSRCSSPSTRENIIAYRKGRNELFFVTWITFVRFINV